MPSSAARTSWISRTSCAVCSRTTQPRRRVSTSPSDARRASASRSGVRLTLSQPASSVSTNRSFGRSSPRTIASRSRLYAPVASETPASSPAIAATGCDGASAWFLSCTQVSMPAPTAVRLGCGARLSAPQGPHLESLRAGPPTLCSSLVPGTPCWRDRGSAEPLVAGVPRSFGLTFAQLGTYSSAAGSRGELTAQLIRAGLRRRAGPRARCGGAGSRRGQPPLALAARPVAPAAAGLRLPWRGLRRFRRMRAGRVRRAGTAVATLVAACASLALAGPATAYTAHGSMKQAYVLGATPGKKLSLVDKHGDALQRKTVSELGGLVFRKVEPGGGYRVKGAGETSERFRVLTTRSRPPDASIYDQPIADSGYQYLTTRDGTKLAVNVYPPTVPTPGPWPTLIEYSGYAYARPGGGASSIQQIFGALGFAVVDVNMRGTGCSGGSFDFFEPAQALDGYDVVETIARQPWVLHNKVGMMGISYGGISQLFTAQTQPPSLAAIAPFSVIDQTQTTLYPGGILNTGFAVRWAEERIHEAEAASPNGGQAWAYQRIQNGDQICKDNQALHPEAVDLLAKVRRNSTYKPKVADPLSPLTFVNKIKAPTFMACQWTDEQTGGHCPTLAKNFTGTSRKWFTFTNGTHVDSLAPETFNRWYDFLQLYVAKQAPIVNSALIHAAAPVIYQEAMGITGVTLPPDPIQLQPTFAGAVAAFEQLPSIRVLFDNGAGGLQPGHPVPGFERSWPSFPIPGTTARSWYLGPNGALA